MLRSRDCRWGALVQNSISSDDLRTLAERFRLMADATALPEYGQLMVKAALELEQQALALKSPERVTFEQWTNTTNVQSLTRRFGDADALAF